MKKIIFLTLGVLLISTTSIAQYRLNKDLYDHRSYVYQKGDPLNPNIAGLASFFVPGLGQMLAGETGRGIGFLAGSTGSIALYTAGFIITVIDIEEGGDGLGGAGLMAAGLGGALVVGVWSIVDAVKVTKVNNLAFRAQNNNAMNLKIEPILLNSSTLKNSSSVAPGLSLKISF